MACLVNFFFFFLNFIMIENLKLSKYSFQNKDRVKMSFNFLCVISVCG